SSFDAKTQYGQSWTYNYSRKTLAGIALESQLTDVFKLRTGFRYGDMWREYQYVSVMLDDSLENYTETAIGSPRQHEITRSGNALVDAAFDTFGLGHTVTFGVTGTNFTYTRGDDVKSVLGTSTIADPVDYDDPALALGGTNVWYEQEYLNWVLGDRIQFDDQWSVLIGFNRASLSLDRWGSGSALSNSNYKQDHLTPTYALMYKPIDNMTTYLSYMEGLATGGTAPTTYNGETVVNGGDMLSPSVSKQYEIGSKATFGQVDLTAALFYIDKINEYTDPDDLVYKQDGRQVHKGVEFTLTGKITPNLSMVGGFTWLDAEIERSNDASLEGKTPVNVPEKQARIYLDYILPFAPQYTVSAGAFYNGKRPVNANNTAYLDESLTFDTGLRYLTTVDGHDVSVNLNVINVFDTAYWAYYRSGDGLFLGEPRTVALNVKISL
ncbi:MAG: TonB-dependent receptor, partial [Desulfobulbus sp.]